MNFKAEVGDEAVKQREEGTVARKSRLCTKKGIIVLLNHVAREWEATVKNG